jgi:hypothetical protein
LLFKHLNNFPSIGRNLAKQGQALELAAVMVAEE